MTNSISSRKISEHLCTLATLLEAEALRGKAFGAPNAHELSRQAIEVRSMADQLWDADFALPLAGKRRKQAGHAAPSADRDAAAGLEALGLGKSMAALVNQQAAAAAAAPAAAPATGAHLDAYAS
jgi:hypothetical protein